MMDIDSADKVKNLPIVVISFDYQRPISSRASGVDAH